MIMYSGTYTSLRDTVYILLGRLRGYGYHVFMDNYYNSVPLAKALYKDGIHVTGTMRWKRGQPPSLEEIKHRGSLAAGEMKFKRKGNVFCILWRANKRYVNMVDTSHGAELEDYIYKKKERGKYHEIPMQRPMVIRHYTMFMGGVDLFDQMVNYYSFARKTQRWTKKVSMYLIQLAIQNAYTLYRSYAPVERKMSLLDFMTMTANKLLHFDEEEWPATGVNIPRAEDLPPEERLDRLPPTPRGLGRTPTSARRPPMDEEEDEEALVDDPGLPSAAPSVSTQDPAIATVPVAASSSTPAAASVPVVASSSTPAASAATIPAVPAVAPTPVQERPAPGPSAQHEDPACRLLPGDHNITKITGHTKQKRCRVCFMSGIRRDTTRMCSRCLIPLCRRPCFQVYHDKRVYWTRAPAGSKVGLKMRGRQGRQ